MLAFSGLDGAGKSTQIDLLKTYLENNRKKVKVIWSRGGYTPGMERLKSLLWRKQNNKSKKPVHNSINSQRERFFNNSFIRKAWLTLAIIDLIILYSIHIKVLQLRGYFVICDRYLFDTQIDFKLNFPSEKIDEWLLWKLLNIFAIKPSKHFILTVPVEISMSRSKQKSEPFPDSAKTLEKRLNYYLNYVSLNNEKVIHIDGTLPINETHKTIIDYLKK